MSRIGHAVPMVPSLDKVDDAERHTAMIMLDDLLDKIYFPVPKFLEFKVVELSNISKKLSRRVRKLRNRGVDVPVLVEAKDVLHQDESMETVRFSGWFRVGMYIEVVSAFLSGGLLGTAMHSAIPFYTGTGTGSLLLALTLLLEGNSKAKTLDALDRLTGRANRRLLHSERVALEASAVPLFSESSHEIEDGLALISAKLVMDISNSTAWNDHVMDEHHAVFSPIDEFLQIQEHSRRITELRSRMGDTPPGDTDYHRVSREVELEERRILNTFVSSLKERVAALWLYHKKVMEVSSQLEALHTIEKNMELSSEFEEYAAQLGGDELATMKLRELAKDAEDVSEKIRVAIGFLTNTLMVPETEELES